LKTNKDLYRFVDELQKTHEKNERSLEEYLRALWALAMKHKNADAIELNDFTSMLEGAFTAPVPEFDYEWLKLEPLVEFKLHGFEEWASTILFQIAELRRIAEGEDQKDKLSYVGIDGADGVSWHNLDAKAFIESGTDGAFKGWETGEDTVRGFAPGQVTAPDPDNETDSAKPQDAEEDFIFMPYITWSDFTKFLNSGQDQMGDKG